jgi:predicted DNA binding protein
MVTQSKIKLTDREKLVIKKAFDIGFQRGYKQCEDNHAREMAELMQPLEALE